MSIPVRACRQEADHDPHFWGTADIGANPWRCLGQRHRFFYRDWDKQVRRFHPPGPDQIQAARGMLAAMERWEEMPDTAGSRWALKFLHWLADYETPAMDESDPRR